MNRADLDAIVWAVRRGMLETPLPKSLVEDLKIYGGQVWQSPPMGGPSPWHIRWQTRREPVQLEIELYSYAEGRYWKAEFRDTGQEENPIMSDVVWCDPGGHLFSANDPERDFYTTPGNEYGTNQKQKRIDICGKHKSTTLIDMPQQEGLREKLQAIEAAQLATNHRTASERDAVTEYLEWREANPDAPIKEFYDR